MRIIGLTGSIATGKSTVSQILSSPPFPLPVIDADLLARQVVEPGTAGYEAIVEYFGPSTPDLLLPLPQEQQKQQSASPSPSSSSKVSASSSPPKPPLNRAVLGRRVFGTDASRRKDRAVLEGIVHPAVRRAMFAAVAKAYARGAAAVVLDVPLLFEAGLDVFCATVVVVGVGDAEVQVARLRARDTGLSEEEAWARVGSQDTLLQKVERVEGWGVVVWNDAGREDLRREVEGAMEVVLRGAEAWKWLLWLAPPVMVVVAAWGVAKGIWRRWKWQQTQKSKDKIS